MNYATVTYENGDVIGTSINGCVPEIRNYFSIGRWFNIGNVTDNMQQVKSVTIETKRNIRW